MMTIWERIGYGCLLTFVWAGIAFLLVPLVVVIAISFTDTAYLTFPPQGFSLKWYGAFLADKSYIDSILLSGLLALLAAAIAAVLGIPAALVLARGTFPGARALSMFFMAPLILPTIVIGAALLQFASSLGFARTFGVMLVGHVVIVIPYIVRTVLASLANFDSTYEEASRDLGAGGPATFFLITLPIIKPGIIAGTLFAVIISWINVELSIFNSTASLMPIPVKIFNYVQYSIDPLVAAISAATIYVAVVAVAVLDILVGMDRVANQK